MCNEREAVFFYYEFEGVEEGTYDMIRDFEKLGWIKIIDNYLINFESRNDDSYKRWKDDNDQIKESFSVVFFKEGLTFRNNSVEDIIDKVLQRATKYQLISLNW